jgi:hypothetical protein
MLTAAITCELRLGFCPEKSGVDGDMKFHVHVPFWHMQLRLRERRYLQMSALFFFLSTPCPTFSRFAKSKQK